MNTEVVLPRATVALGENIKFGYTPEDIRINPQHISIWSKNVVLAALDDHYKHETQIIVFSEGFTAGKDVPSGGEAMALYAKKASRIHFSRELSDEHIVIDKASKDTSSQAEYIKEISNKCKIKIDSVVTSHFHVKRTKGIFNAFNVKVDRFVPAEENIIFISDRLRKLRKRQIQRQFGISDILNRESWKNIKKDRYIAEKVEKTKEALFNIIRLIDPKQKYGRPFARISRS